MAPGPDDRQAPAAAPVVFADEVEWRPADDPGEAAASGEPGARRRGKRGSRVAALAVTGSLVAAVVVVATEPTDVVPDVPPVDWELTGLLEPVAAVDPVVGPAGPDHVLIGAAVVATDGGAIGALPPALHQLDGEGRWAVGEAGRLVSGVVGSRVVEVSTVVNRRRPNAWRPIGPAVAWHDGAALFRGPDGRLGLVEIGGTIRWTTDVSVDPALVRPGTVHGDNRAGGAVEVDLDTGEVVGRERRLAPRLVVDGTEVFVNRDDLVTAVGRRRWSTAVPGATSGTWVASSDGIVLTTPIDAALVDPSSGRELARVPGGFGAPVGGGVVAVSEGGVVLRGWDGRERWRRSYPRAAAVGVVRVDDDRVVVELRASAGAASFAVLDAVDGTVLVTIDRRAVAGLGPADEVGLGPAVRLGAVDEADLRRADDDVIGVEAGVDGLAWARSAALPQAGGRGWFDVTTGAGATGAATAVLSAVSREAAGRGVARGRVTVGATVVEETVTDLVDLEPLLVGSVGGTERWRVPALAPGPWLAAVPNREGGAVVVEVGSAVLRVWDVGRGQFRDTAVLSAPVSGRPLVAGGTVHVPLGDGRLHSVDLDDDVATTTEVGVVTSGVTSACGTTILGTLDGRVVAVDGRGTVTAEDVVGDAPVRDVVIAAGVVVAAVGRDVLTAFSDTEDVLGCGT